MALGYPHNGSIRHCFLNSLMNFREYDLANGSLLGARIPGQGLYIANVRNQIVRDFLTTDCDWLLMIDTDQDFAPHVPHQLLVSAEDAGARVMSALYFGLLEGQMAPMWWNRISTGEYGTAATITDGVQQIDAFGTGMCLIHRTVFEEMAPHYKHDPWTWFGHDMTMFNGHLDRFGEDLCFCDRAGKLGIKLYGNSQCVIGHDKSQIITLETFLKTVPQRKDGEPVVERMLDRMAS